MTPRRYVQLDVFANRPGAGNPLAVVLNAGTCAASGRAVDPGTTPPGAHPTGSTAARSGVTQ